MNYTEVCQLAELSKIEMLEKIANQLVSEEPMLPDPAPTPSEGDVAIAQEEGSLLSEGLADEAVAEEQLTPEELAILDAIEQANGDSLHEELLAKAASEMVTIGTIAKLVQCARGGEGIDEELQKQASEILLEITESSEAFYEGMDRVASELFGTDENVNELFSKEGVRFSFEQLAHLDDEGLDKQADEESPNGLARLKSFASNVINGAQQKVQDAVYASTHLNQIESDLRAAGEQMGAMDQQMLVDPNLVDRVQHNGLQDDLLRLEKQKNLGKGVLAGAGGLAVGGAILGGKKVYDHMHAEGEEKIAEVLPALNAGGTLNVEDETQNDGGIQKMSKIVNDFLKVAGAAGLVSIVNDENLDLELRKEASDAFDAIAAMGRKDMDDAFVKVAQQVYSENELHEIVAGQHTEHLFSKVAYFTENVQNASVGELEKIAGADSVAAKGVAGALTDAKSNIVAVIDAKKGETEGAGRETAGEVTGGGSGKAGGGLVNNLAGYNVINNPSEYNIEHTASMMQEAMLTKQAATETYFVADNFINQNRHLFK
jgi:hypothetical protein